MTGVTKGSGWINWRARIIQSLRAFRRAEVIVDAAFESRVGGVAVAI